MRSAAKKFKYVWEMCPECGETVKIQAIQEVQECPCCRKEIIPCALCDMDKVNCAECPLGKKGG